MNWEDFFMCGITGFTGKESALPFLLQGLERLEYRGYDSAGITLVDHEKMTTYKAKGKLADLKKIIDPEACPQCAGIGHTRWATHGVPSQLNAHPHSNADSTISLVHNGIIENYQKIKKDLLARGYVFRSETDSEVVVHLLDSWYRRLNGDMEEALRHTVRELEGSFALCIVTTYIPDKVFVAKKESPMVIGRTADSSFCGSDATALIAYTKEVLVLEDGQIAVLSADGIKVTDFDGNPAEQAWISIPYDIEAAQKGGYDSYMMKEIHEQPRAVRETLRGRLSPEGKILMPELDQLPVRWNELKRIYFIACGTAYHACIYAKTLLQKAVHVTCIAEPASEFRYEEPVLDRDTLCIFVSQSGETADTLAAVKLAKAEGAHTFAVTNVLGSSLARAADATVYTCAGPEIAVASTKAYTTQLVLLACIDIRLSELLGGRMPDKERIITDLNNLPAVLDRTLDMEPMMERLAVLLQDQRDAYFIGRQLDYPTALEGALKLKEISYIHADAYYAGELKHGPIALIEKDTVVMALATQAEIAAKTFSNIQETIARGARVIIITGPDIPVSGFENVLRLPEIAPQLIDIPAAVLLQQFAYFAAVNKGCDIDQPRNLAKSVTVE